MIEISKQTASTIFAQNLTFAKFLQKISHKAKKYGIK